MEAVGGSSVAEAGQVKRFAKADIEAFVKNEFKAFCKEKCAECDKPATKRFAKTMSFVVGQLLDSYWCNECGRVLCESCRYQHTCERLDQQKERNKHLTHEQLAAQMEEAEARRAATEEEERLNKERVSEAIDHERRLRKDKRQLMAKKAKHVEDFLQGISRDTDATAARGPRVRDELFDLYGRAKRIALTLYNEYEHPSTKELPEEDWEEMKEIYARSRELTGMFIAVEGQPLDMRNPWDPPPQAADDRGDEGGAVGLGRGLL